MRKLNSFELQFWNNISIGILIDAGFLQLRSMMV